MTRPWGALSSANPRQDRTLAPDSEKPNPAGKLLSTRRSRSQDRQLRGSLQSSPLPREPAQSHARRRLLRTGARHPTGTRKDQTNHNPKSTLATPNESRLRSTTDEPRPPLNHAAICLNFSDDGHRRGTKERASGGRVLWAIFSGCVAAVLTSVLVSGHFGGSG